MPLKTGQPPAAKAPSEQAREYDGGIDVAPRSSSSAGELRQAQRLGMCGISFLSGSEDSEEVPEMPVWQRYVEDRMRHFTISHR